MNANLIKVILLNVREILTSPENWTQGEAARDAKGSPIEPQDASATCFCIAGAFLRVEDRMPFPILIESDSALNLVRQQLPDYAKRGDHLYVSVFNDHSKTTHEDVLRVIDKAITLAEAAAPASGS